MSALSALTPDVRETFQDPQVSYRLIHTGGTVPGTAGIYRFYFGRIPTPGWRLKGMFMATASTLAVSATDYIVFRPLYALRGTVYDIDRSIGTNTVGILPDLEYRMHQGGDLNWAIPKGALLGFDATVTASGAPGPEITRPSFWAECYADG